MILKLWENFTQLFSPIDFPVALTFRRLLDEHPENFGGNDLSISRGWTGIQQVLGRGGETRLKVRKEGGGNKSRRAGR